MVIKCRYCAREQGVMVMLAHWPGEYEHLGPCESLGRPLWDDSPEALEKSLERARRNPLVTLIYRSPGY